MKMFLILTLHLFMAAAVSVQAQEIPIAKPSQNVGKNLVQSQGFFPTEFKDWVIIVGTIATALGVVIGVWKGLAEWRSSTKKRREELKYREREFRHKQAVYARDIMNEVFNDSRARDALAMLDWLRKKFKTEDGEILEVRRNEIQLALRAPGQRPAGDSTSLRFAKVEVFIRTRFEALYDHLEEIEKLVSLEIINFEDLETAFRYYMVRALRPEIEHFAFLDYYDYPNAKAFLNRFAKETTAGSGLSPSELEDDDIFTS
jgi:hypothetical protein